MKQAYASFVLVRFQAFHFSIQLFSVYFSSFTSLDRSYTLNNDLIRIPRTNWKTFSTESCIQVLFLIHYYCKKRCKHLVV